MADKDKPTVDEVVEESKTDEVVEESKTEEVVAEESKTEESKTEESKTEESTDAPADAGTDQYGRQLYSVTCASCGKQAQVPFKPSGDRPVYCRDCYMQQRRGGSGGGMGRDRGPRR